ncbi:hypothetical protein VFDL14_05735 [Vibrio fortis]|uniref:Uncharacterized protein n=1 Tax=Vibrio fortis TaxID=212667 RepID=A0A066UT45_9VIBR|nr:hypothetical protein [Vibrio fortis]KDN30230.1 hypothetical protein VFDL14_05735 [Vibrio fortis]
MFFEKKHHLKVLVSFLNRTEHYALPIEEVFHQRLEHSRQIIGSMSKNAQGWDERCQFNIEHIGNNFLDSLGDFSTKDDNLDVTKNSINNIYTDCFRFLCEFDFFIGENLQLSFDLRHLKSTIIDDALKNESPIRSQIVYASYLMPADILKTHLNNKDLASVSNFQEKLEEAKKLKQQWDDELAIKQETVDILDKRLEKIEIGFNFVGLYHGFSALSDKKENELKWLFRSLIGMSVLILAPLIFEFIAISLSSASTSFQLSDLMKLIPLVSIELILIYFFRIVLMNYRSTKAQIMQIELRQTLCQFIQSYSEYASELKSKDPTSLEKFENLIFSGILSDSEKLPSTFDGIDQIGALLKNLKGS